jgi:hypothetical protein
MRSATDNAGVSRRRIRTARILVTVPVLFLVWDSVIKLLVIAPVRDGLTRLGYPIDLAVGIGIVELACLAVFLIPRTAIPGAVLLTGFLGGAVATHVRVGDPLFTHVLFPIYVAVLLWGGLFMRDARLRAVFAPPR